MFIDDLNCVLKRLEIALLDGGFIGDREYLQDLCGFGGGQVGAQEEDLFLPIPGDDGALVGLKDLDVRNQRDGSHVTICGGVQGQQYKKQDYESGHGIRLPSTLPGNRSRIWGRL